jgi:hypothetical protein
MARTEPITRLEVAACPTHRVDVKHYAPYEVGCACLNDERRRELADRLEAGARRGQPPGRDGRVTRPTPGTDTNRDGRHGTRGGQRVARKGLGGRLQRGARLARTGRGAPPASPARRRASSPAATVTTRRSTASWPTSSPRSSAT